MNQFCCTVCGECCRDEQKVWLNPVDLNRLADYLKYPGTARLYSEDIVLNDLGEHGIQRPRMQFRRGPAGLFCPFLLNDLNDSGCLRGRCVLHGSAAKPLVCRLAPLSRSIDIISGCEEWSLIPPVTGCPGFPLSRAELSGTPELAPEIRRDLDAETDWFRKISSDANQV